MLTENEIKELKQASKETRINIVKMVHSAKSGHPGGSLSGADILNVLYSKCLNIPKEWNKSSDFDKRDRFILSKGHASPLLYAVLAQYGLIDKKDLTTFRKFGSNLQGHPSQKHLNGVETSTIILPKLSFIQATESFKKVPAGKHLCRQDTENWTI